METIEKTIVRCGFIEINHVRYEKGLSLIRYKDFGGNKYCWVYYPDLRDMNEFIKFRHTIELRRFLMDTFPECFNIMETQ